MIKHWKMREVTWQRALRTTSQLSRLWLYLGNSSKQSTVWRKQSNFSERLIHLSSNLVNNTLTSSRMFVIHLSCWKDSLNTKIILHLPPAQNTIRKYMQNTMDKIVIPACYTTTASMLITINGFSDSRDPCGPQISNPMVCSHTHHYRIPVLGKVYSSRKGLFLHHFCFTTCTRAERDAWHTSNWTPLFLKPPCFLWK